MNTTSQIATQFKQLYFGGNWTAVNLKDTLEGVEWQQATTPVHSFNSIAALVFHINYYVNAVTKVLQGNKLEAHDKFSFALTPVDSAEAWEKLLEKLWMKAELFASLVEQLPDSILPQVFAEEKYGSYYRNLTGIIEHTHYHLGQIVLIKKLLQEENT